MISPIYRVDRFAVPAAAEPEFLERVRATHALLEAQPGCLQSLILRQVSSTGDVTFVTLAAWESDAAIEAAKAAVRQAQEAANFRPSDLLDRLGIAADIGIYTALEPAVAAQ